MMIRTWADDGWRKRFALLPLFLSNGPERTMVWLEPYWSRFAGLYTEISLTDPCNVVTKTRREVVTSSTIGWEARPYSMTQPISPDALAASLTGAYKAGAKAGVEAMSAVAVTATLTDPPDEVVAVLEAFVSGNGFLISARQHLARDLLTRIKDSSK